MINDYINYHKLIQTAAQDALIELQDSPKAVFEADENHSIKVNSQQNIFIEGDNITALKLLLPQYENRIKMIYIDPPYNTGSEFVFNDNYRIKSRSKSRCNSDTDSFNQAVRFHLPWISMMLPRLLLSRNFLSSDGIIFISIDDNEIHNLKTIMNLCFGEENFLAQMVRQTLRGGTGPSSKIRINHDYVLVYAKNKDTCQTGYEETQGEPLNLTDEKGPYRKGRELNKWGAGSRREDNPAMFFPIKGPGGVEVFPIRNDGSEGRWRWGRQKMQKAMENDDLIFQPREDGTYIVFEKIRSSAPRKKAFTSIIKNVGDNAAGTEDLKKLFDGVSPMDFPKPVSLLMHLIKIGSVNPDDIIMDFFAGSGTTAEAVLRQNLKDRGRRKFILVQASKPVHKRSKAKQLGFNTIADICRERIKRVLEVIQNDPQYPFEGKILSFDDFKIKDKCE